MIAAETCRRISTALCTCLFIALAGCPLFQRLPPEEYEFNAPLPPATQAVRQPIGCATIDSSYQHRFISGDDVVPFDVDDDGRTELVVSERDSVVITDQQGKKLSMVRLHPGGSMINRVTPIQADGQTQWLAVSERFRSKGPDAFESATVVALYTRNGTRVWQFRLAPPEGFECFLGVRATAAHLRSTRDSEIVLAYNFEPEDRFKNPDHLENPRKTPADIVVLDARQGEVLCQYPLQYQVEYLKALPPTATERGKVVLVSDSEFVTLSFAQLAGASGGGASASQPSTQAASAE